MRPLVLVHGFTGSAASFDRLRARVPHRDVRTPVLLGHRGEDVSQDVTVPHRRSPGAGWEEGIDRLARQLEDVVEPFDLLGYSLGGRAALGLVARMPERIASLVLVGAHLGLRTDEERTARRAHDARFVELLRQEGIEAFAAAWESQPLLAPKRALAPDVLAARTRERRSHEATGLARSLERMGLAEMPDLRSALVAYPGPVTYVVGEHDGKFRDVADEAARLVPRARIVVVADAAHDVVLEAPEALADLLVEREAGPADASSNA